MQNQTARMQQARKQSLGTQSYKMQAYHPKAEYAEGETYETTEYKYAEPENLLKERYSEPYYKDGIPYVKELSSGKELKLMGDYKKATAYYEYTLKGENAPYIQVGPNDSWFWENKTALQINGILTPYTQAFYDPQSFTWKDTQLNINPAYSEGSQAAVYGYYQEQFNIMNAKGFTNLTTQEQETYDRMKDYGMMTEETTTKTEPGKWTVEYSDPSSGAPKTRDFASEQEAKMFIEYMENEYAKRDAYIAELNAKYEEQTQKGTPYTDKQTQQQNPYESEMARRISEYGQSIDYELEEKRRIDRNIKYFNSLNPLEQQILSNTWAIRRGMGGILPISERIGSLAYGNYNEIERKQIDEMVEMKKEDEKRELAANLATGAYEGGMEGAKIGIAYAAAETIPYFVPATAGYSGYQAWKNPSAETYGQFILIGGGYGTAKAIGAARYIIPKARLASYKGYPYKMTKAFAETQARSKIPYKRIPAKYEGLAEPKDPIAKEIIEMAIRDKETIGGSASHLSFIEKQTRLREPKDADILLETIEQANKSAAKKVAELNAKYGKGRFTYEHAGGRRANAQITDTETGNHYDIVATEARTVTVTDPNYGEITFLNPREQLTRKYEGFTSPEQLHRSFTPEYEGITLTHRETGHLTALKARIETEGLTDTLPQRIKLGKDYLDWINQLQTRTGIKTASFIRDNVLKIYELKGEGRYQYLEIKPGAKGRLTAEINKEISYLMEYAGRYGYTRGYETGYTTGYPKQYTAEYGSTYEGYEEPYTEEYAQPHYTPYEPTSYIPPYTPTYEPPTYTPTYEPPPYTPTYKPPPYIPTYTPTYEPPPYTPTYLPPYEPPTKKPPTKKPPKRTPPQRTEEQASNRTYSPYIMTEKGLTPTGKYFRTKEEAIEEGMRVTDTTKHTMFAIGQGLGKLHTGRYYGKRYKFTERDGLWIEKPRYRKDSNFEWMKLL